MIYVTGDVHADISRFNVKCLKKNDTLIICGDFGFIWHGDRSEEKILKRIGKLPFYTLFVDGTHENFDLLKQYKLVPFAGSTARNIDGKLFHLTRGNIYEIEGKRIFAFGGGESYDKELRKIYDKYWSEELPLISEMKYAVNNLNMVGRKVDYIITHEPTSRVKELLNLKHTNMNSLNKFFDELSENVEYDMWYFGSMHKDKQISFKQRAIFSDVIPINSKG